MSRTITLSSDGEKIMYEVKQDRQLPFTGTHSLKVDTRRQILRQIGDFVHDGTKWDTLQGLFDGLDKNLGGIYTGTKTGNSMVDVYGDILNKIPLSQFERVYKKVKKYTSGGQWSPEVKISAATKFLPETGFSPTALAQARCDIFWNIAQGIDPSSSVTANSFMLQNPEDHFTTITIENSFFQLFKFPADINIMFSLDDGPSSTKYNIVLTINGIPITGTLTPSQGTSRGTVKWDCAHIAGGRDLCDYLNNCSNKKKNILISKNTTPTIDRIALVIIKGLGDFLQVIFYLIWLFSYIYNFRVAASNKARLDAQTNPETRKVFDEAAKYATDAGKSFKDARTDGEAAAEAYIIEKMKEALNNPPGLNETIISWSKDHSMVSTDSVVYNLCRDLALSSIYTGSAAGSGYVDLYEYVEVALTTADYLQLFNNMKRCYLQDIINNNKSMQFILAKIFIGDSRLWAIPFFDVDNNIVLYLDGSTFFSLNRHYITLANGSKIRGDEVLRGFKQLIKGCIDDIIAYNTALTDVIGSLNDDTAPDDGGDIHDMTDLQRRMDTWRPRYDQYKTSVVFSSDALDRESAGGAQPQKQYFVTPGTLLYERLFSEILSPGVPNDVIILDGRPTKRLKAITNDAEILTARSNYLHKQLGIGVKGGGLVSIDNFITLDFNGFVQIENPDILTDTKRTITGSYMRLYLYKHDKTPYKSMIHDILDSGFDPNFNLFINDDDMYSSFDTQSIFEGLYQLSNPKEWNSHTTNAHILTGMRYDKILYDQLNTSRRMFDITRPIPIKVPSPDTVASVSIPTRSIFSSNVFPSSSRFSSRANTLLLSLNPITFRKAEPPVVNMLDEITDNEDISEDDYTPKKHDKMKRRRRLWKGLSYDEQNKVKAAERSKDNAAAILENIKKKRDKAITQRRNEKLKQFTFGGRQPTQKTKKRSIHKRITSKKNKRPARKTRRRN